MSVYSIGAGTMLGGTRECGVTPSVSPGLSMYRLLLQDGERARRRLLALPAGADGATPDEHAVPIHVRMLLREADNHEYGALGGRLRMPGEFSRVEPRARRNPSRVRGGVPRRRERDDDCDYQDYDRSTHGQPPSGTVPGMVECAGVSAHEARGGNRYSVMANTRYTASTSTPLNHAARPLLDTNAAVRVAINIMTTAPGQNSRFIGVGPRT